MHGESDFLKINRVEATTIKEIREKGYRNATDISVEVNRKTKLNAAYITRLVMFIVSVILLRFPGMGGEVLVIGHGAYYGGKLLRMVRRWVTSRAKREMKVRRYWTNEAKKKLKDKLSEE